MVRRNKNKACLHCFCLLKQKTTSLVSFLISIYLFSCESDIKVDILATLKGVDLISTKRIVMSFNCLRY